MGLTWLIEAAEYPLASLGIQLLLTRATDSRMKRCGVISLYQSAVTSEIVIPCLYDRANIEQI